VCHGVTSKQREEHPNQSFGRSYGYGIDRRDTGRSTLR
jgi:hypothetical protein